jgi:hypothetical protein
MTAQEVISAIPQFTFEERLELIERLSLSLRTLEPAIARRGVSASKVMGTLKPDTGKIPDDEEVKEIIAEYLMEKYS